jgi:hypothetical protein
MTLRSVRPSTRIQFIREIFLTQKQGASVGISIYRQIFVWAYQSMRGSQINFEQFFFGLAKLKCTSNNCNDYAPSGRFALL